MRRLALSILVLAACDLKPGQPPQKGSAAATVTPTPAEPAPATADGEPAPQAFPGQTIDADRPSRATPECTAVATHIAKLTLESMTDPDARTRQERVQPRMIRSQAESCTRARWSEAARSCLLAAKTLADTASCQDKLGPPPG